MGLEIFRHYELRARSKKDVMARARDGGILSLDLVLASCSFLLRNVVSHLYTVLSNAFFMCVIMFVANIWSSFVFEFRSHSNSSRSTRRNSTVLRLTLVVGSGEFILVHRHSQTFLEKFHSAGMQREVHSVLFETVEVWLSHTFCKASHSWIRKPFHGACNPRDRYWCMTFLESACMVGFWYGCCCNFAR